MTPLRLDVVSVVGARPQFVKVAVLDEALRRADHDHVLLHTGQHYDDSLSTDLFSDLSLPEPEWNLGVGSGSHGRQTAAMLAGIEDVLRERRPDWVVTFGDTNSTVAGALAAAKTDVALAHVEAGLRSFDRTMPEEVNRVVTDHVSDLLLAPTQVARENLEREGLGARCQVVGDVMIDMLLSHATPRHGPTDDGPVIATIHRAENTDDPERLSAVLDALAALPVPVVLLAHPRLRRRAADHSLQLSRSGVDVRDPIPYRHLLRLLKECRAVVTDSGGLQREAYTLGVPCTTLRDRTEWPETLAGGWNRLASPATLADEVLRRGPTEPRPPVLGDGHAAPRIVSAMVEATPATMTGRGASR